MLCLPCLHVCLCMTRYQAAVLFSMGYAAHYLAEEGLKHSEVGRLAKELKDLQRQER